MIFGCKGIFYNMHIKKGELGSKVYLTLITVMCVLQRVSHLKVGSEFEDVNQRRFKKTTSNVNRTD